MDTAKQRVRETVEDYTRDFSSEYESFKLMMKPIRDSLKDEKFGLAETGRNGSSVTRALYEMPETLQSMLVMKLEPDEMVWFKSKEGGRWFARTFRTFAIPAEI